jgi:hypothetical protein
LSPRYQQFGLAGRHKFDGNGSRIPQLVSTPWRTFIADLRDKVAAN